MDSIRNLTVYKDMLQVLIDRGITRMEDFHHLIADFAFEARYRHELSETELNNLKTVRKQNTHRSYEFVREINRQIGQSASEFLGVIEHRDNIKYLLNKPQ